MSHSAHSRRHWPTLLLSVLFTLKGLDVSAQLFHQDSLQLIARQFAFTEGPAVDKYGDIYFTDQDRKSTRLNSSHLGISYAVFCLKKKKL